MANHDFILPYSPETEGWLRKEGCVVPASRPDSRHPNMQEVIEVVESQGLGAVVDGEYVYVVPPPDAPSVVDEMTRAVQFIDFDEGRAVESPNRPPLSYLVVIHCFAWEELNINEKRSITMRGNFPLELFLVHDLTERCGQLLLYPDTGDPPVVLEPGCDVERMASAWLEAVEEDGSWADFYQRINRPENS